MSGISKAAYFIAVRQPRFTFVSLDEKGTMRLTSCPHEATLFLNQSRAYRVMRSIEKMFMTGDVAVIPSRTSGKFEVGGP